MRTYYSILMLLCFQFIPRFYYQFSRPILPKLLDFLLLQHAKRLAREIFAVDFFRIDIVRRVAQLIAGETVERDIVSIQFGAELGTRWRVIPMVLCDQH